MPATPFEPPTASHTTQRRRDGTRRRGSPWGLLQIASLVALCSLLIPFMAMAAVRLPAIISENMVLQRDTGVRIWGWAQDGETVTVEFAGQTKTAKAGQDGRWLVTLDPLAASAEPRTMVVTGSAGGPPAKLANVLVGEVWVSCGQSNMMMGLGSVENGTQALTDSVNYPNIHVFNLAGQFQADTPQEDVKAHWQPATPQTLSGFSAVSYFFGRALNRELKVPVGLINVVAIMPAEAWVDKETLLSVPALRDMPQRPIKPITTYNGMIAPLTRYAMQGAIYYQGEYNAGRGREFRELMPALIRSWRTNWGREFPFLFVQLPGFQQHLADKDRRLDMPDTVLAAFHQLGGSSAWAELREAQLRTSQTVAKSGMAICIDLGDAQDIHPKRKEPVGERLALAARAIAYGAKIEWSGPIFESVKADGKELVLRFTHVGKGLTAKGAELKGFEIAGADQKYIWAKAEIRGDAVVVSAGDVAEPVFVRYAWADYPTCNLYNAEGLPASPFRAHVAGKAFQVDSFAIAFRNPGFEAEGEWNLQGGAARNDTHASDGKWSVALPPKAGIVQDNIAACGIYGYDWNSDLLEPNHFRPGTVTGYTVDIAADGAGPQTGYMRLCANSSATGYQYWGGIPNISTASRQFVTRRIASQMTPTFDLSGAGAGVGTLFAHMGGEGTLYVDHLSPITVIRPRLAISDTRPIDLGEIAADSASVSAERTVANSQTLTLPDQRDDAAEARPVPTVLYGVCNLKSSLQWGFEHVWGETDHVGAVLIGKDAGLFEFVSEHRGATPQELKLVGADGKGGLVGGPTPEAEKLVVRFVGSAKPGRYTATARVVTQAGNLGTLSDGAPGEPFAHLWYVDIPVSATVK